jgi:glyoxylate reductase
LTARSGSAIADAIRANTRTSMPKDKPVVVVSRKLPDVIETRMMELFDVRLNLTDEAMTQADLLTATADADVLVPTVTDRIDAKLINGFGDRLKLIANYGTGVDHIDLQAARKRGITVTNTPDVLTEDTAEMTMALILAVPRRLTEGERVLRAGEWPGWSPTWMLGSRVSGKRLGIVGMGRIGQAVARRARAFDMKIHYHNRRRVHPDIEAELDATYHESLDQMLARMDIITIHCPHTPATFHLLSARRLKLLQPHAYIVNTARGEIIDETALIRLLRSHDIAGAALDVFENEPAINRKLLTLDNVVLLPHMGSATWEGRIGMGECVLVNVKSFVDGHAPPNWILPEDVGF